MDTLVLFTKKFPLEKGETFLNNEIGILSDGFKKVIIIVCSSKNKNSIIPLPSNVTVFGFSSRSFLDKIKILLNIPRYLFIKEDKFIVKGNVKKRIFRSYFFSSTKLIFNKIKHKIKSLIDNDEKICFYSYWFYDIALASCFLEQYLKQRNITLVSRAHGYDLYEYRNKLNYLPLRETILSKLDRIYCCSKNGQIYLKEKYPIYQEKIAFSYLGTKDYGVQSYSNCNLIVSCSNLISLKRIDLIIDCLYILKSENIDFMWYHIGDGPLYEKLYKKANSLLGKNQFQFLGYLENDKVIDFYRNNNVKLFINVSSSEGLPVSIMEAISFGIPAVATNVGGTKEIVINDITGELISPNSSPNELSNAIKKILLMNKNDYNELRLKTRFFWESNFSTDNYIKFMNDIKLIK